MNRRRGRVPRLGAGGMAGAGVHQADAAGFHGEGLRLLGPAAESLSLATPVKVPRCARGPAGRSYASRAAAISGPLVSSTSSSASSAVTKVVVACAA